MTKRSRRQESKLEQIEDAPRLVGQLELDECFRLVLPYLRDRDHKRREFANQFIHDVLRANEFYQAINDQELNPKRRAEKTAELLGINKRTLAVQMEKMDLTISYFKRDEPFSYVVRKSDVLTKAIYAMEMLNAGEDVELVYYSMA